MSETTVLERTNPHISIEQEMRNSYLDYAMSVIVSRAIPDARDGLKPVHRRILYGMLELGCDFNKPYKKSARIVGDVMGKYHPHGDSAIYDALVRMAQPFSMSLLLVDGQGNFGSMDGDPAAAMRYTESRLSKAAHSLLNDIDKDTIDWQENYDGSEKEPKVLPAAFPNLLVNGAGGIAVGMATNIPPHNLGEVIDACCLYIDNTDITIDELMQVCPGPDFPTGGIILGRSGARNAMHTGRGSIVMRAKTDIEEIRPGRQAIIVHEIPYQVNKAKLVERIAELVRDKKLEGISDLRDESDKQGVRVVIEIKKDAQPDVVLNQLFSYTPLQTSFGSNMLALDHGKPVLFDLKHIIASFIQFREEVINRRTRYLLDKARNRAHLLIGLAIAVANIDEVVALIRASKDPVEAKEALMRRNWNAADVIPLLKLVDDRGNVLEGDRIYFTEAQAKAILELRLQRLTGLEQEKINGELQELGVEISGYLELLGDREKLMALLRSELLDVKEQFAVPRRTAIEEGEFEQDIEDLIPREDMVVTVTARGYIKRVPLATYRAQKRGGKGRSGANIREEDALKEVFVTTTHTPVLFFSNKGKVYKLKVYRLPVGSPQSQGRALINLLPLEQGETIEKSMPLPEDEAQWNNLFVMFATAKGNVRRNPLSDFHNVMRNGKIAIRFEDDSDWLIGVEHCADSDHILLAARSGKCVRFPVDAVREFKSRTSTGVRGMKLGKDDVVMSLSVLSGVEATPEERSAYLKRANQERRAGEEEAEMVEMDAEADAEATDAAFELSEERYQVLAEAEQFILTLTENGYGKRSSAYEYRATNRGTQGYVNINTSARNGQVVASFPVEDADDILLITDAGKLIRCPVEGIRIAGRATQGVTVFRTAKDEKVVSVSRVADTGEGDEDESLEVEHNPEVTEADKHAISDEIEEGSPAHEGEEDV